MGYFVVYEIASGIVRRAGVCQDSLVSAQASTPQEAALAVTALPPDTNSALVVNGVLTSSPSPGPFYVRNQTTGAWEPDMPTAIAAKIASLQQSRDAASAANVVVGGSAFAVPSAIQTGIKRLADRLAAGKTTALKALLDANGNPVSPVTLSLLQSIEDAVAANTEAAWNQYGTLVAQAKAATTLSQLDAITWT